MAEMLNKNTKKLYGDQVRTKDIESNYHKPTFSEIGSISVIVFMHCELILALYTLNSPLKLKTIEIGVSKRLCLLCQKFVKYLNVVSLIQVFIFQNQGKISACWRILLDTSSGIEF